MLVNEPVPRETKLPAPKGTPIVNDTKTPSPSDIADKRGQLKPHVE